MCETTVSFQISEVALTITGAGGFGKSTIAKALCYHPVIKERFTNGFIFCKIGANAAFNLIAMYKSLANKRCDLNNVEQNIKQITSDYYRNLLVILDDVWCAKDVEPIIRAFTNCTIVITTRKNSFIPIISSKHSCIVGPMESNEAFDLLTNGITDINSLTQADKSLVNELICDAHYWPLLLSLIKAHISSDLNQYHCSFREAVQNAYDKLHKNGLTSFDKNILDSRNKFSAHLLSVQACIEITLEEISQSKTSLIALKSLVLWTGINTLAPITALHSMWKIPEQDVKEILDNLWSCGTVNLENVMLFQSNTQKYVKVVTHFSEYILEGLDSNEVCTLSPLFNSELEGEIIKELIISYQQCMMENPSLLLPADYLKYKLSEIENVWLPFYYRIVCMHIFADPHLGIVKLHEIFEKTSHFKDWSSKFNSLKAEYMRALKVSKK